MFPPPHAHTLEVIFRPLALPPEKTCSIFFSPPPPSQIRVLGSVAKIWNFQHILGMRLARNRNFNFFFNIFQGTPTALFKKNYCFKNSKKNRSTPTFSDEFHIIKIKYFIFFLQFQLYPCFLIPPYEKKKLSGKISFF